MLVSFLSIKYIHPNQNIPLSLNTIEADLLSIVISRITKTKIAIKDTMSI